MKTYAKILIICILVFSAQGIIGHGTEQAECGQQALPVLPTFSLFRYIWHCEQGVL